MINSICTHIDTYLRIHISLVASLQALKYSNSRQKPCEIMAISRFWNQLYSAIVFLLVCGMVSTLSAKPNQKKLPQTGKAILHFRPEGMKAGDVIPFFWKGSYHLFYLEGPDWGHIVSQDLLHWQELPKALVKGADPQGPDWESIWTGSIVEHNGTFFLFYTGKNSNDPLGDQKVMQARSTDLIHW